MCKIVADIYSQLNSHAKPHDSGLEKLTHTEKRKRKKKKATLEVTCKTLLFENNFRNSVDSTYETESTESKT